MAAHMAALRVATRIGCTQGVQRSGGVPFRDVWRQDATIELWHGENPVSTLSYGPALGHPCSALHKSTLAAGKERSAPSDTRTFASVESNSYKR